MSSYRDHHQDFSFRNALAPFAQDQDLPLAEVLSEADVVRIFAEEKVSFGKLAHSFWTPAITLWAFLWQVISPDKSCRQVVANVLMSFALSQEPEDIDTGLHCRARAKLPVAVLRRLSLHVGQGLERVASKDWLWKGKAGGGVVGGDGGAGGIGGGVDGVVVDGVFFAAGAEVV